MDKLIYTILIAVFSLTVKGQNLPNYIDSLMEANQIPELGFAVVSPDSILELQTLGFHRIDNKNEQSKAKLSDYFHLGSNTKAITGFIAAYLVEKNKIKWATCFFDLFPEWKNDANSVYHNITLADLLAHRAKIQPYTNGSAYKKLPAFEGNNAERRQQFSKYLLIQDPVVNNQTFNYSNAGYSLAALMLEKASGKTWEQLTKEIFASELNVKIEFGWPNKLFLNQPYGHWVENNILIALPPDINYDLSLGEPAGDISMTLPDYARFIQLNLQGLSGKDNVLKSSTYQFLHLGLKKYSIGWGNVSNDQQKLSEHAGSAGTFYTYALIDHHKNLGFIVIMNSGAKQAQQGLFKVLQLLRTKYGR